MSGYPGRCFVYLICHEVDGRLAGPCKIGISEKPEKRLKQVQNGNPRALTLAFCFHCWDRKWASHVERIFHELHASQRMRGEWFDIKPRDALAGMLETMAAGLKWLIRDDPETLNTVAEGCNVFEAYDLLRRIDAESGRVN